MVNRSDKHIEIKAVQKENLVSLIRRVYERFIRIRGEPREVALGFALGIFVGMTPTIGVQTPIAIFLAALFKWSKLSAAIGVWISNPLTAPIIYSFTYITGAKLLSLDSVFNMPLSPTWSTLKAMLQKAPRALGAMTVGGRSSAYLLPLSAIICPMYRWKNTKRMSRKNSPGKKPSWQIPKRRSKRKWLNEKFTRPKSEVRNQRAET